MAKSTRAARSDKPRKPRPYFPLYIHATGRWAKRVRGKIHYFGKHADFGTGEQARSLLFGNPADSPVIDLPPSDDMLVGRFLSVT